MTSNDSCWQLILTSDNSFGGCLVLTDNFAFMIEVKIVVLINNFDFMNYVQISNNCWGSKMTADDSWQLLFDVYLP